MNKPFHQNAPLVALKFMPEAFRAFLICDTYSEDDLKRDADIPDMVDKDNITQDAEIHHAHSYKLEMKDNQLHWVDGDALERLKGLCADAHDFKAEGKVDMVRYCLGKMTHYRIDSLTYPHLHRGKPWSDYHARFETEMGHFILENMDKIDHMEFKAYDDIYKACRKTALEAWPVGLEIVKKYEAGTPLTDEDKLNVLRICVQGVGDLWLTLAKEMKLV